MMKLDTVDQQLLDLLRSNARASTSALARTLGVSAVRYRIESIAWSGIYDLVATVQTVSPHVVDGVLNEIGTLTGVGKTTTSIVLATRFQP